LLVPIKSTPKSADAMVEGAWRVNMSRAAAAFVTNTTDSKAGWKIGRWDLFALRAKASRLVRLRHLPRLVSRLDHRTAQVAVLLGAVAVLNFVDLFCTLFAQRIGELSELNPLADVFLRLGLVPSLICYKILMVFCGLGVLWKGRRSRLCVPACWVLLAVYVSLSILWYAWANEVSGSMEVELSSAVTGR
jgi:hypothetical protein